MSAKRTVTCFRSPSRDCREANIFSANVWEHSCPARVPRELRRVRLLRPDLWFGRKFCKTWLRDGSIHHMGPGDVLFAEDLTGQGHTRRVVSEAPRVAATVPVAD